MAINFYVGGPGAGKSVFAMKKDIMVGFFEGRKILSNINGIPERLQNTSVFLKKYHKKNKNIKIKELLAEIEDLIKINKGLTDLEIDILEENILMIEGIERKIAFINSPDYSVDTLKKTYTFLTNEDKSKETTLDKLLNGGVISMLNLILDDDLNWNKDYANSLIVVDESKKFFSPEIVKKFDDKLLAKFTKFIGEHRHNGLDITFIDQEFWSSSHELIRFRTQAVYSIHSGKNTGIKNGYFAKVYVLTDTTKTTFEKAYTFRKTISGQYNLNLFKCYHSVSAGAKSVNSFDKDTVPFLGDIKNVIGLLVIAIVSLFFLIFALTDGVFGGDKKKEKIQIKKTTSSNIVKNNSSIVSNKNPDSKKIVDESFLNKLYYSEHPIFKLIKDNIAYCNGSISDNDFDFNYSDIYNGYTKENEKKDKNEYLTENYSDVTSQSHYLTVVDDTEKVVFISNTKELAEHYHLEIKLIDNCYYKIKNGNEILTIYPFDPVNNDVVNSSDSNIIE
jgi:zona occludens toxin (predicted ATPase)